MTRFFGFTIDGQARTLIRDRNGDISRITRAEPEWRAAPRLFSKVYGSDNLYDIVELTGDQPAAFAVRLGLDESVVD